MEPNEMKTETHRMTFWQTFWKNLCWLLKAVGKIFYFVLIKCHLIWPLLIGLAVYSIWEDHQAYRAGMTVWEKFLPKNWTPVSIMDKKYFLMVLPVHMFQNFLSFLWAIKFFYALGIAVLGCAAWSFVFRRKA